MNEKARKRKFRRQFGKGATRFRSVLNNPSMTTFYKIVEKKEEWLSKHRKI